MTRVTQDLIDNGKYIRGVPLVNLDANGDGQVGYHETHLGSPVLGRPVSGNEPLGQDFRWPVDPATGQPYEIGSFPVDPRHSADAVRLPRRAVRRRHGHVGERAPIRQACCARRASAGPCRSRAGFPSALHSIRARSASAKSTIGAPPTSRSRTRISASSSSTSSTTSTKTSRSRISSSTTVSTASRTRSCRTARTKINGSWRTSSRSRGAFLGRTCRSGSASTCSAR